MKKSIKIKGNRGMSYVELIVVLSIFSVITSVVLFNYGDFQAKVDIKNLASDIALQVVQAQKSALSGRLPPLAQQSGIGAGWQPAYGVYFNIADNKSFTYFVDLNANSFYELSTCSGAGECLDKPIITKNNSISRLEIIPAGISCASAVTGTGNPVNDLGIVFKRPDSGAKVYSDSSLLNPASFNCVQITILSPKGTTSLIKLYPSGRVQID